MAVRKRVRAHGRVQGVFFRDATRRVSGWAANRSDGTVEAVFEGEPDAVDAMLEFIRSGPGHAEVAKVDISDETPEGIAGFQTV